MKIHRILGMLWLALSCYSSFNLLRVLVELHRTPGSMWVASCVPCVVHLAGIVASIFLFRGARWARWVIALIAFYMVVFGPVASVLIQKSLPIRAACSGVFALVSIVLLFLPRHEPVA